MAMAATQIYRFHSLLPQRQTPARFVVRTMTRNLTTVPTTTQFRGVFLIRASNPERGETNTKNVDEGESTTFISPEDLNYLVKLGAGSFAAVAAIKYGSIIFPEITRPNIVQALVMISTPVFVAVFLLIKQSQAD